MTLAQKTITGILWNFTEQICRRGIGIIITLLLARLLAPEDFGLVAMMAVFLALATNLMQSGFIQALVRLQRAAQCDFNTAFFANLILGAVSYGLLFLAAPLIASFYEEPRLILLIRVAGIKILIHAFQIVQIAQLTRELNFKAQLQASIPAGIISGFIAVALAYMDYGVWALIVQMLFTSLFTTLMLWHLQSYRPTRSFSRRSLVGMYNFGYKLFLSGFLNILRENLYIIVIAKLFSAGIAGYYFFANKLTELVISQIVGSIQKVTYPALATLQDDNERLKAGYRTVIQVTTFILFPTMLLLAALAEPLFAFLLPSKWFPAVLYLQLMCLGYVTHPLHAINLNILQVKGRSDLFLYLEIVKTVMVVAILLLAHRYGIIGILLGQIIGSILTYIPNSYFSFRLIGYSVREQMADFMPGLALSGAMALVIYGTLFFLQWQAFTKVMTLSFVASVLYLVGAHMLKLQAYMVVRQMVSARFKRSL